MGNDKRAMITMSILDNNANEVLEYKMLYYQTKQELEQLNIEYERAMHEWELAKQQNEWLNDKLANLSQLVHDNYQLVHNHPHEGIDDISMIEIEHEASALIHYTTEIKRKWYNRLYKYIKRKLR